MRARLRALAVLAGFILASALLLRSAFFVIDHLHSSRAEVVVGSKAFTESIIVAEILSQTLERSGITVDRRYNLGSTQICLEALRGKTIDLYPEYTGTGLVSVLHLPSERDPEAVLTTVTREFEARYGIAWLPPLGFSNTYALAVPRALASKLGITRISDLVSHQGLVAGFAPEFLARDDGYPGLEKEYGLRFREDPRSMEAGLMYQAAAAGEVDVVSAYSTDGRVLQMHLLLLEDDRHFFPPYQAAPIARRDALARSPRVREILGSLAGSISEEEMRRMNLDVDAARMQPEQVAAEFLRRRPQ